MCKKMVGLSIGLILVLLAPGSLAQTLDVEVSSLMTPADLDLSGEIVYAINFGDNGSPTVGGIVFSQDQEYPAVTVHALGLEKGPSSGMGPFFSDYPFVAPARKPLINAFWMKMNPNRIGIVIIMMAQRM